VPLALCPHLPNTCIVWIRYHLLCWIDLKISITTFRVFFPEKEIVHFCRFFTYTMAPYLSNITSSMEMYTMSHLPEKIDKCTCTVWKLSNILTVTLGPATCIYCIITTDPIPQTQFTAKVKNKVYGVWNPSQSKPQPGWSGSRHSICGTCELQWAAEVYSSFAL
jgi:hypothetical protein